MNGEGRGISAVFEVILRELIDGIEGFLGLILVIARQNFLNVRQTVAEEHVLGAEEANAAGTLVECRKRLGGFSIGAFFIFAVLFRLRLNTHGFRRYALRAYAPLRPAMCSTAARSARIRRASLTKEYSISAISHQIRSR